MRPLAHNCPIWRSGTPALEGENSLAAENPFSQGTPLLDGRGSVTGFRGGDTGAN
jgi:hypothetical protein